MDISKMFCRVDSEHFKDFLTLVSSQFGIDVANKINHPKCTGDLIHYVSVADPFDNLGGAAYSSIPSHLAEFKGLEEWSIYNNTKVLSELSDEQRGLLFNHWCNFGNILASTDILSSFYIVDYIENSSYIYRAKQKSEQELFIEAANEVRRKSPTQGSSEIELLEAMFNSGKFKLV